MLVEDTHEEHSAESTPHVRRVGTVDDLCCLDEHLESTSSPLWKSSGGEAAEGRASASRVRMSASRGTPVTPDVRLYHRAVVVAQEATEGSLRGLVRQLSIDQFENEGRRVSLGTESAGRAQGLHSPFLGRTASSDTSVHKIVLAELLEPRQWQPPEDRKFVLSLDQVVELCDRAELIFQEEPTVLHLQAPVKIFGDLHGQFGDLMRLF
eukprot:jgi/Botrbrau1/8267/Bobra.0001s0018.1